MRHSGEINKSVLFVHVPKTGGTSIRTFLTDNGLDDWNRNRKLIHHDPLSLLLKSNHLDKDTFIFSVIRNPYTRAFSYYKHFLHNNQVNRSFHYFLDYVRNRGLSLLHNASYHNTPMVIYNQSYYLHDDSGELAVTKLYKYECLNEFESDFNVSLPKLNTGNYNLEEYLQHYDKQCIGLVKQIYLEDFINFNYSTNFEESVL